MLDHMSNKAKLIYIAGYGRSGSTFLERLLQYQPSIRSCGEMANFFRNYGVNSNRCSCGYSLERCQFWGAIAKKMFQKNFFPTDFYSCSRIQKKREGHWSHGGSFHPDIYHDSYATFMRPFFDALVQTSSEKKILIDSSKTSYSTLFRPEAISQLDIFSLHIIHLIRDPKGVVWSVKKGLNRVLEGGMENKPSMPVARALVGWIFANIAADRLKNYFGESKYYMLKYEDLIEDPVKVLHHISFKWNIDLQESICAAKKAKYSSVIQLPIIHQLSGNRMRFSTTFSIKPDYTWKEKMNPKTKVMIKTLTMPFSKKYGYF